MAKLKNMTIEDVQKLFRKQGSNPNDIEKVNGKGAGENLQYLIKI